MDQKERHIEYMVQFSHSAYLKYQESSLAAFESRQQKLAKSSQIAEIGQASIELAGANLKSPNKEGEKKKKRTDTQLKKKISRAKKQNVCQKCSKILKHSSSLSRHQKKCKVQKQKPLPVPSFLIPDELLIELE